MKKTLFSVLLLLSVTCLFSNAVLSGGISWFKTVSNAVDKVFDDAVNKALGNAIDDAESSFVRSISDYYAMPQNTVTNIKDLGIPDEEIPVVFYLANRVKIAPLEIAELRLNGISWQGITSRFGHGAEIYYVPVNANEAIAPPYGHAYGYFRNKPKADWNKIMLTDGDIINLVNLKFLSEHYKYPAGHVMKMRQQNKGFYAINHNIAKQSVSDKKSSRAASVGKTKAAPAQAKTNMAVNKKNPAATPKTAKKAKVVKKQTTVKDNPDHLTGTKKQLDKAEKFLKKKNEKAKKFINDKG